MIKQVTSQKYLRVPHKVKIELLEKHLIPKCFSITIVNNCNCTIGLECDGAIVDIAVSYPSPLSKIQLFSSEDNKEVCKLNNDLMHFSTEMCHRISKPGWQQMTQGHRQDVSHQVVPTLKGKSVHSIMLRQCTTTPSIKHHRRRQNLFMSPKCLRTMVG